MDDGIKFTQISGPGVDALENRKEVGSIVEITEQEMRDSYERVKQRLFAGIKRLTAQS